LHPASGVVAPDEEVGIEGRDDLIHTTKELLVATTSANGDEADVAEFTNEPENRLKKSTRASKTLNGKDPNPVATMYDL
jgi:hypothetical protein